MKQAWTAGTLAAILFGINFLVSIFLGPIGPAAPGLVTGFSIPFMLALGYLMTGRFGTVALTFLLYSIAAIPTLLIGVPGVYKVVIGISAGLATDLVMTFFPKRFNLNLICGLIAFGTTFVGVYLAIFWAFDVPGRDRFIEILPFLVGIFFFEGIISVLVAARLYERRLRKVPSIRRLRPQERSQ